MAERTEGAPVVDEEEALGVRPSRSRCAMSETSVEKDMVVVDGFANGKGQWASGMKEVW